MTAPQGYTLVFSDDFDTTLDQTKWEIVAYAPSKYTWLPCATSDNIYTENGNLVTKIKSGTCPGNTYNYNNGITITKYSWTYGYFETRAKLAPGTNINNAFWLIGKNWAWPPEIDIYETAGYDAIPDKIYMTYHWKYNNVNQQTPSYTYTGPDYSQDYHVFGMEWTPDFIRWLIDDTEVRRIVPTDTMSIPSTPMSAILSINKGWVSSPDPSSLPGFQYIDYVRIYQSTGSQLPESQINKILLVAAGVAVLYILTS